MSQRKSYRISKEVYITAKALSSESDFELGMFLKRIFEYAFEGTLPGDPEWAKCIQILVDGEWDGIAGGEDWGAIE
jgi:hypothetical protein